MVPFLFAALALLVSCADSGSNADDPDDVPRDGSSIDADVFGGVAPADAASPEPGAGTFGAPCNENADCVGQWCVESGAGGLCSHTCGESCPDGWGCRVVQNSRPDVVSVCVPDESLTDASLTDASLADASPTDTALSDAALADAAPSDSAWVDASMPDASMPDATVTDAAAPGPPGEFVADFPLTDFAVTGEGAAVLIGQDSDSGQLFAQCFAPQGERVGPALDLGHPPENQGVVRMTVARARRSGHVAINWYTRAIEPVAGQHDWRSFAVFLDADCSAATVPVPVDPESENTGIIRESKVVISDDGRALFLYENQSASAFRVVAYHPGGAFDRARTIGAGVCGNGALSNHIAIQPSTGGFVVVCESEGHRAYRRFDADLGPIENGWVRVIDSGPTGFHMFGVARNDDGAFVYFGLNQTAGAWLASFYDANGQLTRLLPDIDVAGGNDPWSAVAPNGDFFIEARVDGADGWARYTPAGVLVERGMVTGWKIDDAGRTYRRAGGFRVERLPAPE